MKQLVVIMLLCGIASAQESILTNVSPAFKPGPYTFMKVDPTNPERFVVGTPDGWVLETRDGGSTANESRAFSPRTYFPMVLRGLGGNHGTQWQKQFPRGAHRLFISVMHAGLPVTRWAPWMAQEDPSTEILDIALSPAGGRGLVAGPNGVFVSDERMSVWTRALGYPRPKANVLVGFSVAVDPSNPKIMFAGTSDGMLVSYNGGTTFSKHPDKKLAEDTVNAIIWDQKDPNNVILLAGPTVYKSENHGESFDVVLSGDAEVNAMAQAEEGVYVATKKGLSLYAGEGTTVILKEDPVVGVVPVGDHTVLAATETNLYLIDKDGKRTIKSTNEADPFVKLAGTAELAWALTKYGIFRIGVKEPRAKKRAKSGPQMLLSLEEVQRATNQHMGIGGPTSSRLNDRWYAALLPMVTVNLVGEMTHSSMVDFDRTFPIGFRYAQASSSSVCCGNLVGYSPDINWSAPPPVVMAHWDLARILFGAFAVSNPNGLVEAGLRNSRISIMEEIRWRYTEMRNLCAMMRYPPKDEKTLLSWIMRLEEYEAYLEAVSGKKVLAMQPPTEDVDEAEQ